MDFYGFPDGDFLANESQSSFPSAASKDTKDTANNEYRTSEWFNSTIPAPPPPPPRTKTMGVDENGGSVHAFIRSKNAQAKPR